ncbi:MAG: hypothetical protein Q9191_003091 [Dirinaria sp. TL-2023a]
MAPIAASTQSRNKLRAFQFDQENSEPSKGDGGDYVAKAENGDPLPKSQQSQHIAQQDGYKNFKECPQTPMSRLPLAELVASGEDTNQRFNLTPVERVLWQTRDSEHGSSQKTPAGSSRRKRAHSSSPVSSSQKKYKTPGHVPTLERPLKTPQADPAGELWKRYSLNACGNKGLSPTRAIGQPFSQLMNSSSPETPARRLMGRECIGLRRSFSCGAEWPTSAAKRRKTQHVTGHHEPAAALVTQEAPNKSQVSRSRLSLLVAKIQEGLARPASDKSEDVPTSSGKSPCQIGHETGPGRPELSSSQARRRASESPTSEKTVTPRRVLAQPQEDKTRAHEEFDDPSSEFGDDELDIEVFEAAGIEAEAESSTPCRAYAQQCNTGLDQNLVMEAANLRKTETGIKNGHDTTGQKSQIVLSSKYINSVRTSKPQDVGTISVPEINEFDEDTNGISTEDLESAFAIYEDPEPRASTGNGQEVHQKLSQQQSTVYGSSAEQLENMIDVHGPEAGDAVVSLSEDEFGGDLDFEQIVAECEKATQGDPIDPQFQASVLLVTDELTKLCKAISLRQSWVDTPCTPGSYVHFIGQVDRAGQCLVDDAQGLLILHPDHLLSATVVADSFSCTRRAILQDRVKATGDTSQPQIYGSLLHEIFQEAMKANRWDTEWLGSTIERIAARYLEKLFEINVELSTAINHLKSKLIALQNWAEVFVTAKPKPTAVVQDRNGGQSLMSVNKLLEVEEKIWSPKYGLKGMIDATVQIALQDSNGERTLTVPLEVKTGKNSNAAHKAQTALYTLLCSDRYDLQIACGILYYMETSETSRVPAVRHELIHMIKQRNELACYARDRFVIPPMLKNSPHLCGKCYAQTACFTYHKLAENGDGEANGLKETFDELVEHLKPVHQAFFTKWDNLLTKEEKDVVKIRRELWTMQSSEREKVGRCFSGVIIEAGSYAEVRDAPKINRYCYTFVKQKPAPRFSFTESQITLGEPIVISDENGHFALASGYVTHVRKSQIQVTVDRRLDNSRAREKHFDSQTNQSFIGIMDVAQNEDDQSTSTLTQPHAETVYRIDMDEFSNGMAIVRNNLINIMEKQAFNAQPLRRLIVENTAPTFRSAPSTYSLGDSTSQANLNVDQKAAIEKVMSAKDYALVLGMPGTGKTTTIAHIIRALTAQGKSVLLTSYTHTAVDNILLKIRKDNIGVFRLGAVAKVHPEVQEFADLGGVPMKTIEELKRAYNQQVVATTCLGINHPIFSSRIFDYCIVDEASQITLPVCLGPIRMARTFILVGDHYQLPPLVQNKEAQEGGLDISLFKMLSDNHPSSVVNLEHQYRMCEDIMTLSNTLIYNGRLKCGTPAVATRSLTIPHMDALAQHHHNPTSLRSSAPTASTRICLDASTRTCWLRNLLCPSRKACFVNTDPLLPASREAETGSRITNPFEATLCTQLIESLLSTGVPAADMGIITLYRSQLTLLKHNLRHRPQIEMHTADKFQGRDKEVIVLSLVRSNESCSVGDLLKDWRRVNVALTRARTKLLVVGSRHLLEGGSELLRDFVRLMESRGWWFDLRPGALEAHVFDDGGEGSAATQGSARGSGAGVGGGGGGSGGGGAGAARAPHHSKMSPEKEKENDGFEGPFLGGKKMKKKKKKNKSPGKRAGVDIKNYMAAAKRSVLRDIVNDAAASSFSSSFS